MSKAGASTHSGQPQPPPRGVQELAEARKKVQPAADLLADGFDREPAVGSEQPGAIEDGDGPDVLGPAEILRPHHAQILRTQTFHKASPNPGQQAAAMPS